MDIALALAGALLFALGTVLQQLEASAASADAQSAGFLLRLARRPRWLAGMAADGLGFVCQAAALAAGRLAVVQPLLASSVVFALPLASRMTGRRITRREWLAAAAVTGGLAVFLVAGDPTGGREDATNTAWFIAFGIAGAVCAALFLAARGRQPAMRASLLGIATGILFGLSAGLTKATVERLDEGVLTVFTDWHLYALAVVGYASLTLSQMSLATGELAPAISTQMTLDPLVSVLLGIVAFQESLDESPLAIAAVVLSLAAMAGGILALARGQAASEASSSPRAAAAASRPAV